MSALVDELLSFSKASLGPASMRLQPVSLRPVVEKAIRREAVPGMEIRLEVSEDIEALGDAELLLRSLSNLLRNAIGYAGHSGPITISAKTLPDRIELLVSDNGPGVPEKEIPKLFDPFYRVDPSRARQTGGVGLGLAIVKTCIETCRGSVTCRNRQPGGFEVIIRLRSPGKDAGKETTPATIETVSRE